MPRSWISPIRISKEGEEEGSSVPVTVKMEDLTKLFLLRPGETLAGPAEPDPLQESQAGGVRSVPDVTRPGSEADHIQGPGL